MHLPRARTTMLSSTAASDMQEGIKVTIQLRAIDESGVG